MLEMGLFAAATSLAIFFFLRWQEEKARSKAWQETLEFAQKEVARMKEETERLSRLIEGEETELVSTDLRLPNIEELLKAKS